MELWQEIFCNLLKEEKIAISFPQISDISDLLDSQCYCALKEIQQTIKDDTLSDKECFMKIEEIICVFEKIGSNGGNRHDFG